MFGLFKKKNHKERLESQYRKLLKDSYTLSTTNRKASDQKRAEAEKLLRQIEALD